jgi:hypothetical protein
VLLKEIMYIYVYFDFFTGEAVVSIQNKWSCDIKANVCRQYSYEWSVSVMKEEESLIFVTVGAS